MSAPNHNNHDLFDNEGHYDLEQWTPICRTCLRTVSSTRPPVYNADNCSCTDLAGTQIPQPAASPGQGVRYEHNTAAYYPPQSYPSSTASVPCPEGVEREDPNLHVGNNYLPIAPDLGHNEPQHRRSASIHSNMSFQLARFLEDLRNNQPRQDISPQSDQRYLSQTVYIQSQAVEKQKKERKGSKRSYRSFGSSGIEEYGFVVGADATAHVGEWVGEMIGDGCYEMTLSGRTDELKGE